MKIPLHAHEVRRAAGVYVGLDAAQQEAVFGRSAAFGISRHPVDTRARAIVAIAMRNLGCSYPECAISAGLNSHTSARQAVLKASDTDRAVAGAIVDHIRRSQGANRKDSE